MVSDVARARPAPPGCRGITATLTGSSLLASEHAASVLVVYATTNQPVSLDYGYGTERTVTPGGALATVRIPFGSANVPENLRVYLMIDAYPGPRATLGPPP